MFLALMLQNVSVLFMVDLCQCVWCVCVCVCVCVCMRVKRKREREREPEGREGALITTSAIEVVLAQGRAGALTDPTEDSS